MPTKHPFVTLLICQALDHSKHSGLSDTLTLLRERYWILRGRQATKKAIRACVVCRKAEGPPYASSPSADLPLERVSEDPPFMHTGLDFAGPLYVANSHSQQEKAYITCVAMLAMHLELVKDLGVETFLLVFRRFAGRRGLPAMLISDNAKAFQSSSKEVSKMT